MVFGVEALFQPHQLLEGSVWQQLDSVWVPSLNPARPAATQPVQYQVSSLERFQEPSALHQLVQVLPPL